MKIRVYILAAVFTILFFSSCVPTRQLGPNEYLLYKVNLKGVEQNDPARIEALYSQQPNRRILGSTPYLSVYYFGKKFYNPAKIQQKIEKTQEKYARKIEKAGSNEDKVDRLNERLSNQLDDQRKKLRNGNWLMRTIGEPPAIYDTAHTRHTVDQINIYLHSKGYFRSAVSYDTTTNGKLVTLNLNVTENQPFRYSQLNYAIRDTAIINLLQNHSDKQLLHVGDNYDEEVLANERDRIETLLRNNGYYFFRKQYIEFNVDTSFGGNTVRLETLIANRSNDRPHRAFRIKNVYFTTDAGTNRFGVNRDTVEFRNIKFLAYDHRYSSRVLANKLSISPGQLYSLSRTNRTLRQITELAIFRSTSITYEPVPDSVSPQLNAYVNVSPEKKYLETSQMGINLTQGMPGPLASLRLSVLNIFGGAEIMEFGVQGGLEGQRSQESLESVYKTELIGNVALNIPRIKLPFLYKDYFIPYNPRTRFNLNYTFVDRPQYTRTNAAFSISHIWQRSPRLQYSFTPANVEIINTPRISQGFNEYLEQRAQEGYELRKSFESNFVSSMSFIRLYNGNNISQTRNSHFNRSLVELGGIFTKELYSSLFESNNKLTTFRYIRLNNDYRRYIPFKGKRVFVYRLNAGWTQALFSGNKSLVPYDRFFFAGGASSIRAWPVRRLGPGSFTDTLSNRRVEQPGNILLETNVEYRFNIFSYLNGALFVDAGNVWVVPNKLEKREGAIFELDQFYRQIAVGAGFGLRFDFEFLIIRFDIANKIFDPSREEGDKFVGDKFSPNLNFGIGYPF